MISQYNKEKLSEILKKYNFQKSQEELEKIIEDVISKKLPSYQIGFYLVREGNYGWVTAANMGGEILDSLSLEELEKPLIDNEILEEIKKIPQPEKPKEEMINLDQLIEKINKETGLSFQDEILAKRFKTTILSYLKDIRDEIELKEILEKSQKIGGMGIVGEKIDQIIGILEREKLLVKLELKPEISKVELAEGIKAPEELVAQKIFETKPQEIIPPPALGWSALGRPSPKEFAVDLGPEPPMVIKEKEKQITKFQLGSLVPVLGIEVKKEEIEKEEEEKIKEEKKEEVFEMLIPEPRRPAVFETREKVEAIKPRIRILGPVEEIKALTLDDWRRFGKTENAVARIEEKINLLAEESLFKKAEAIKAWKESEVNHLYLEIGRESIEKSNVSVTQIIEERKKQGKPSLSLEEFNAVAELNQKLRF